MIRYFQGLKYSNKPKENIINYKIYIKIYKDNTKDHYR